MSGENRIIETFEIIFIPKERSNEILQLKELWKRKAPLTHNSVLPVHHTGYNYISVSVSAAPDL